MKRFCVLLLILVYHNLSAQNTKVDTVSLARSLTNEKKFQEANDLLSHYNSRHTDIHTLRDQAQILYWMKQFKEAGIVYERAYTSFPTDTILQRDYAQFLFGINKLYKAQPILEAWLARDNSNAEALRMLSYIALWTGHTAEAKRKADLLEQLQPGNSHTADILYSIANYTTPVLSLNGSLYNDDQPLTRYTFNAEGEIYRSWFLAPYLGVTLHQFNFEDAKFRTSWVRAGNKFYFGRTKTTLDISAGSFRAREHNAGTTYKAKLVQKIKSDFSIDGSLEKKPYQYTLASVQLPFLYKVSELGLNYNRKDRWLGRVAYQHQNYADTNSVSVAYAWLLAPLLHKNNVSIKAGYGFSNSNAKENTFIPKQTNQPATLGSNVEGVYDPYFTPFDQTVHSLLASLNYNFTKKISMSSNISIGFAASAYQPYYVVDGNNLGQLFISKQYSELRYNPIEFSAELKANISQRTVFNLMYQYNSLIFFKSHFVNLQLKYLFVNEKRKI